MRPETYGDRLVGF